MSSSKTFLPPIERPDIVIPDSGPLIHLAIADELRLLHEIGGRVVIVDVVRQEVTGNLDKNGARKLQEWIEAGLIPGSNNPVEIAITETGSLLRLARLVDPQASARNAGERAIIDWLGDRLEGSEKNAIVVYENGKVPNMIARQGLDINVDVLTTRAFLTLAENRRIIPSAEKVWQRIVEIAPTTNPSIQSFSHRRISEGTTSEEGNASSARPRIR